MSKVSALAKVKESAKMGWCLSLFEETLSSGLSGNDLFLRAKSEAFDYFSQIGFPSKAHPLRDIAEEWRYSNTQFLNGSLFNQVPRRSTEQAVELAEALLSQLGLKNRNSSQVVFLDGKPLLPSDRLSSDKLSGVRFSEFGQLFSSPLDEVSGWAARSSCERASYAEQPFVALNTACLSDGLLVFVEPGARVQQPIELIHLVSDAVVSQPRVLLFVGAGAQVSVVERFLGLEGVCSFTNAVLQLRVEEGASLEFLRLQNDSRAATHISSIAIEQARDSRVNLGSLHTGAGFGRQEIRPLLGGMGGETLLSGLTILGGEQHFDNHLVIDHAVPNCFSRELFKGLYAERSSGVFSGTIIVRQDAQKTNAVQSNQTLLLSPEAVVETRPQLKIFADDVKCTHGATIGQIDQAALFYLQSRGIGERDARKILLRAFAEEFVSGVKSGDLQLEVSDSISDALHRVHGDS